MNFLQFLARAVPTWKFGAFFLPDEELDSSGDAVPLWRNAWLDVGYVFSISFWLSGSHVFGV